MKFFWGTTHKLITMKINKTNYIFFVFIILLFTEACSTKKVISSDVPIENIDVSEIIRNSKKTELKFKNIRNRIKVEFDNGRSIQSVNLNLRALDNEILWLSASIIVPIAKVLMSNDRFVFYEKFQKTYIDQDISKIMKTAGLNNPAEAIQNLLYGRPFVRLSRFNWQIIKNRKYYVLNSSDDLQVTLFFNPKTFKIDQQRIYIPYLSSLITFNYRNYKTIDDRIVPNNVEVNYIKGNKIVKINIQYSQYDFPENLTFPMEIPADYKIKSLDEILN